MRNGLVLVLLSWGGLVLPACGGTPEDVAASDEALGSSPGVGRYYTVQRDARLCPSPTCGGFWIAEVNGAKTQCSDGNLAARCYVSGLNTAGLALGSDGDVRFRQDLETGRAIARGTIAALPTAPPSTALIVSEGWRAIDRRGAAGGFFRLETPTCTTRACPPYLATYLDSERRFPVQYIDWSQLDAPGMVQGLRAALASGAIVATGNMQWVPLTRRGPFVRVFQVTQAFTRVTVTLSPTAFCSGDAGCAADQVCQPLAPSCGAASAAGTCVDVPEVCPMIYRPVCGCDGRTYSNDCVRLMAREPLAHVGACETQ